MKWLWQTRATWGQRLLADLADCHRFAGDDRDTHPSRQPDSVRAGGRCRMLLLLQR